MTWAGSVCLAVVRLRSGSTAKVLVQKCKLKYYRISECQVCLRCISLPTLGLRHLLPRRDPVAAAVAWLQPVLQACDCVMKVVMLGRDNAQAPAAGAGCGLFSEEGGSHHLWHGLCHQLCGHPIAGWQGLLGHQRRPEPCIHRGWHTRLWCQSQGTHP